MSLFFRFLPCYNRNKFAEKIQKDPNYIRTYMSHPLNSQSNSIINDDLTNIHDDNTSLSNQSNHDVREIIVILEKAKFLAFGFTIIGGLLTDKNNKIYSPIKISQIANAGLARISNYFCINDIILDANSVNFKNVAHDFAVSVISSTSNILCLTILRKIDNKEQIKTLNESYQTSTYDIEFNEDIEISISSMYCTFVGWIHTITSLIITNNNLCPLQIADSILEIDNLSCDKLTRGYIINKLKSNNLVTLKISRKINQNSDECVDEKNSYNIKEQVICEKPNIDLTHLLGERDVHLVKNQNGYGMNIIGGDVGDGVFISSLTPNSPAAKSGLLFRGDRILKVNGIDLTNAVHDFAVAILRSNKEITVTVINSPRDLTNLESNFCKSKAVESSSDENSTIIDNNENSNSTVTNNALKVFYVRSLFDHIIDHKCTVPSKALGFKHGSILKIMGNLHDLWWQATLIDQDCYETNRKGIIPGNVTMQKRAKIRSKSVKFSTVDQFNTDNNKKGIRSSNNKIERKKETDSPVTSSQINQPINYYQIVERRRIDFCRPIVICGVFKDRIIEHMIRIFPKLFFSPIPYSTHPQISDRLNDRDKHFVMERSILQKQIETNILAEIGSMNNELYAVSIASIKQIAYQSMHCILNLTPKGIRTLVEANLYPIVVFINSKSVDWVLQTNKRITREHAEVIHANCLKDKQLVSDLILEIITGETMDEIHNQLFAFIERESTNECWVPCSTTNYDYNI